MYTFKWYLDNTDFDFAPVFQVLWKSSQRARTTNGEFGPVPCQNGVCENWENDMLILLISTQRSYFCDNDAIYDVIMQEPVRKWRHNHRHKINRNSFAE